MVTLSDSVSAKLRPWKPTTLFHPLYEHFPKGPTHKEARRQLGISKEGDVAHLFFGLIRPYKGLGVLLEALGRLPSHHKLLVAGECYEDWSSYQALIDQHELQERVQLHLEFIPDNLVPVFMQACDDVVLPYLDASQSGVTALALHHEKRVVASDVGDLGTSIVPNLTGRLVPPVSLRRWPKRCQPHGTPNRRPSHGIQGGETEVQLVGMGKPADATGAI